MLQHKALVKNVMPPSYVQCTACGSDEPEPAHKQACTATRTVFLSCNHRNGQTLAEERTRSRDHRKALKRTGQLQGCGLKSAASMQRPAHASFKELQASCWLATIRMCLAGCKQHRYPKSRNF